MAKQCKLTVICENSVAGTLGLIGEHGWSVYLEMGEIKIIFDTGQGLGFIHNAELLGIPLREVDGVVLSHGHFDHASGLGELLHHGGGKKLFCHPDCFQPRFSVRGKKVREVGMSFGQEQLKSLGADIQEVTGFTEIYPSIYLTGEIPRNTEFESMDSQLKIRDTQGNWQQDQLWDDMSLVVETDRGLLVLLGCAHAGIINILHHVTKQFPDVPIDTVVGGTHLGFADQLQFEKTLQALEVFKIRKLGTAHCTGLVNGAKLHQHFGDSCFFAAAGTVITC